MLTKQHTTKPRTKSRTIAAPVSRGVALALDRFSELPVTVVWVVMWMAGWVLLGACLLLAYAGISALAGMVAVAF
jgi:hypothetical protein